MLSALFVLSVLEAPNTKTNSLCVQTHLAIKHPLVVMGAFEALLHEASKLL